MAPAARSAQPPRPELRLEPGLDCNALVAAAPAGMRIILAPGRYDGWSVMPKDGQSFEAAGEGVVLDGGRPGLAHPPRPLYSSAQ